MRLVLVHGAGHSMYDPGITSELVPHAPSPLPTVAPTRVPTVLALTPPPPSLLFPLPVSLLYTPPHASPEASHDRPDAEVTLHFANDFRGV